MYIYDSGKGILIQNKKHWLIDFWHFIKGCEEYSNNCNTYGTKVTDKYDNTSIEI